MGGGEDCWCLPSSVLTTSQNESVNLLWLQERFNATQHFLPHISHFFHHALVSLVSPQGFRCIYLALEILYGVFQVFERWEILHSSKGNFTFSYGLAYLALPWLCWFSPRPWPYSEPGHLSLFLSLPLPLKVVIRAMSYRKLQTSNTGGPSPVGQNTVGLGQCTFYF